MRLASFLLSLNLTGSLPVSLWLSMALCDSHSGSHWLSLPLSGILWPSLAHYCSLISRIQPLIGSQGSCLALIADATMTHYIPLWSIEVVELTHKRNFNRHSKYKPAVVLGGVWWIVLSKGWRFSFGLCELIACFWHHIFFVHDQSTCHHRQEHHSLGPKISPAS